MIVAVLQARMSSSRLPGKVLKPILGKPMLELHIERINRCHLIDSLIVATSDHPKDDCIANLCEQLDINCFRGSLPNVLERIYLAAQPLNPAHVVRLTGDCPVADPEVIDAVINKHLSSGADYCSNCHPHSFPDGLDVEVMQFSALEQAAKDANTDYQKEHVTPFILQHPELFKLENYTDQQDFSHLRWTVDEAEDFELITHFYQELYPTNPQFKMRDILALLAKKPELSQINSHFKRNENCQSPDTQGEK